MGEWERVGEGVSVREGGQNKSGRGKEGKAGEDRKNNAGWNKDRRDRLFIDSIYISVTAHSALHLPPPFPPRHTP